MIFDRPGFPWNKGNSFGVRSCEVDIITYVQLTTNMAMEIETMNKYMYLLLKMVIFQPAMLVSGVRKLLNIIDTKIVCCCFF